MDSLNSKPDYAPKNNDQAEQSDGVDPELSLSAEDEIKLTISEADESDFGSETKPEIQHEVQPESSPENETEQLPANLLMSDAVKQLFHLSCLTSAFSDSSSGNTADENRRPTAFISI